MKMASYSIHAPIVIADDSGFTAAGFTGGGTWSSPYMLQGVNITSDGTSISINNTRAVFLIKDCLLTSTGNMGYGISLDNSTRGTIDSCNITSKAYGISLVSGSENSTIMYNTLANHSSYSIRVRSSYNTTLINNTISNSYCAIYLYESNNSTLINNTLYDNGEDFSGSGIAVSNSNYVRIDHNTILDTSGDGIFLSDSNKCSITNNTSNGNVFEGLWIYGGADCDVIKNVFVENDVYGIRLEFGTGYTIYDNLIGWYTNIYAGDTGSSNSWDDGISIGNRWGNYDGVGVYTIPGSANSVDHYPLKADTVAPVFTSTPTDFLQDEAQSWPVLTWAAYDAHPYSVTVLHNGTDQAYSMNHTWNGSDIELNISFYNLLGLHNFTVIVTDTCSNMAKNTVLVTVVDKTAPTISHPSDINLDENLNSFQILWNANDTHPGAFTILKDGNAIDNGFWVSYWNIVLNVNDILVGTYNYTCVVYDTSGNWASDTVIVVVSAVQTTTTASPITPTHSTTSTEPPPQIMTILMIAGAIGIVIVVVVLIAKRRK